MSSPATLTLPHSSPSHPFTFDTTESSPASPPPPPPPPTLKAILAFRPNGFPENPDTPPIPFLVALLMPPTDPAADPPRNEVACASLPGPSRNSTESCVRVWASEPSPEPEVPPATKVRFADFAKGLPLYPAKPPTPRFGSGAFTLTGPG